MKPINFSNIKSVILSGGEPGNFLSSQNSLEPQSKDLTRTSAGSKQREEIPPHKEYLSQIALSSWATLPRGKETYRSCKMLSSLRARSFDCGSGSSPGRATSIGSPSLRMTGFFFKSDAKGVASLPPMP